MHSDRQDVGLDLNRLCSGQVLTLSGPLLEDHGLTSRLRLLSGGLNGQTMTGYVVSRSGGVGVGNSGTAIEWAPQSHATGQNNGWRALSFGPKWCEPNSTTVTKLSILSM